MDGGGAAELPFDSVYASEQSGIDSPMRTLVRTPGEWASVWASVTGHVSPTPPGPEVDFDRFMLVAVGLGRRPSGGYAARITGIESTPARLTVTVEEVEPGPGCIETMALTAPVIVVRVERVDARVSFREIRRERSCD